MAVHHEFSSLKEAIDTIELHRFDQATREFDVRCVQPELRAPSFAVSEELGLFLHGSQQSIFPIAGSVCIGQGLGDGTLDPNESTAWVAAALKAVCEREA